MFLLLPIIPLAGWFGRLHAFFLAAVQVLVYAGAVMVLFLFVIMLLDLKQEERRRIKTFAFVAGLIAAAVIAATLLRSVGRVSPLAEASALQEGTTAPLGQMLFRQYLLPFEV